MTYRVTHYGANHRRHRLLVRASTRALALAWVEQRYGDAWYLSAVVLPGVRG